MMKTPDLLPKWIKSLYGFFAVLLVCALLIENPLESSYITSIVRQEFVLAHLADASDYFSAESPASERSSRASYRPEYSSEFGRSSIIRSWTAGDWVTQYFTR